MERIAWQAIVLGVEKSQIQLGNFHFIFQVVLVVKNLPTNPGDTRHVGLIPGLGRSSGEENGTRLQYSCLENSMGR